MADGLTDFRGASCLACGLLSDSSVGLVVGHTLHVDKPIHICIHSPLYRLGDSFRAKGEYIAIALCCSLMIIFFPYVGLTMERLVVAQGIINHFPRFQGWYGPKYRDMTWCD